MMQSGVALGLVKTYGRLHLDLVWEQKLLRQPFDYPLLLDGIKKQPSNHILHLGDTVILKP